MNDYAYMLADIIEELIAKKGEKFYLDFNDYSLANIESLIKKNALISNFGNILFLI